MGERLVTQDDGQAAVAYLIIEGLGDRTEMERATSVKNWNASGVFAIGFGIAFDGSTYIPPLLSQAHLSFRPVRVDCYSIFLLVTLQLFFSLVILNQKMMILSIVSICLP